MHAPLGTTIVGGTLEFARRRPVTPRDIQSVAELACRVPMSAGTAAMRARILCFLADGVRVFDPVGMECTRLGAEAELTVVE